MKSDAVDNCLPEIFESRNPLRRPIRIQILLPFSATMVAAVAIIAMTSAWLAVRRTEEQTLLRIQNVVET